MENKEGIVTQTFAYPDSVTRFVDSLYDSGCIEEADGLLEFLDQMGEQATIQYGELLDRQEQLGLQGPVEGINHLPLPIF